MEGVLCTCSLIFFLLVASAVNPSQGFYSEDLDLFPFSLDKILLEQVQGPTQQPPLSSPSPSPAGSRFPPRLNSINHPPPRGHPRPPKNNESHYSNPGKKGLNNGKMAGLVLVSIAGVLQVAVLTYLLVKRRQMLRVVEKYEV